MASATPDFSECHGPLAGTKLYCLVTKVHVCEQLAQGRNLRVPSESRTSDLAITSPIRYTIQARRKPQQGPGKHSRVAALGRKFLIFLLKWCVLA